MLDPTCSPKLALSGVMYSGAIHDVKRLERKAVNGTADGFFQWTSAGRPQNRKEGQLLRLSLQQFPLLSSLLPIVCRRKLPEKHEVGFMKTSD